MAMHICFFSPEYPLWNTGGIGSFIQTLGIALVKKGCRVTVILFGDVTKEEEINDQGVHVIRLAKPKIKYLRFLPNMIRLRKKLKEVHQIHPIDVLETPEIGQAFIPCKTDYLKVIRMHGGHHYFANSESRDVNKWKSWQEKRSFKNADYLIGVSNFVANETKRLLSLGEKKVEIIYNPVDLDVFKQDDSIALIENQILYVGTVCEKKGVHKLIEAMYLLIDKGYDVQLKVVGRDWINPKTGKSYIEYLKSHIPEKYQLFIDFVGAVPHHEVAKWLSQSQMVVLPSFMEAMPIAWLEVLAMGKPLIASKTGPGFEVVTPNKTGLLCDPYKPRDIAEKIEFLLNDPEKAKEMGVNAQKDVFERFDIDRLMDENYRYFQDIVTKG